MQIQNQTLTTTSLPELSWHLTNLASNNNVDWNGVCNFDERGGFISFKNPLSKHNKAWLKPIPKDEGILREARNGLQLLEDVMRPATQDQIAIAIKKLSLHCGMQAKAPEEVKFMFMDYCHDLKEYPIKLIERACEQYRKLPDGNKFLPSSGQLIAMMAREYNKMKLLKIRIEKILGIYVEPKAKTHNSVSLNEVLEKLI